MDVKDPKETPDFAETLRRFTSHTSPESSTFKMSKRNQDKWSKIRKRVKELKGGR